MNLSLRKILRDAVLKRPSLFKMLKLVKGEGYKLLLLDYPYKPAPRYGYGKPSHKLLLKLIESNNAAYRKTLRKFLKLERQLLEIPLSPTGLSFEPYWANGWLPALDFVALYSFISIYRPKIYLEIGSGLSTKLAKRAVLDNNLSTKIISIDPEPREKVDGICDKAIRQPLEKANLNFFWDLTAGDILFIDGSHRCLMNSDVNVFFLDILPKLKHGIIIGFHDIFLPNDYPPGAVGYYYSEQYMLALYLLSRKGSVEIIFPGAYISSDDKLSKVLNPLWRNPQLAGLSRQGASFWIRT